MALQRVRSSRQQDGSNGKQDRGDGRKPTLVTLSLLRLNFREDGIFGCLRGKSGSFICRTLERSYLQPNGKFYPKVKPGIYYCEKGYHRLKGQKIAFQTFELMDVPGHTGILIHPGNFNFDSEGCILVGESIKTMPSDLSWSLTESKKAFDSLLKTVLDDLEAFELVISDLERGA